MNIVKIFGLFYVDIKRVILVYELLINVLFKFVIEKKEMVLLVI